MDNKEMARFIELLDSIIQPIIPHLKDEEQTLLKDGLFELRQTISV